MIWSVLSTVFHLRQWPLDPLQSCQWGCSHHGKGCGSYLTAKWRALNPPANPATLKLVTVSHCYWLPVTVRDCWWLVTASAWWWLPPSICCACVFGAGSDPKEMQPDTLSASFKSSLSEFGVPRLPRHSQLWVFKPFKPFLQEGLSFFLRCCHGNVTFLERTWGPSGPPRPRSLSLLGRCRTQWRSLLLSLWSLPVLRLRALLRVLRPPPARVVEVAQRMTFEAVVWGNCGSGRGVFFLAKAGSQKWKEHETATYTKDCNCLPLNFDTFMWLDRFWLVQALLPESSLLSL